MLKARNIEMDVPFLPPRSRRRKTRRVLAASEFEIHISGVAQILARGKPGLVFWHTPNDGKRSMATARRLQTMGMRAGVADLCLVFNGNFYAMELKTEHGRPTEAQMQWAADINAAGGHAVVCHDIDRAVRCLEVWGLIK